MTTTLVTGIAELVTLRRHARGRRARRRGSGCCATPRSSSVTAGSSGPGRRRGRRTPTRGATWRGGPSSRGSWTPTPTWCSPGTGRPSSPRACPATPYDGGGIATSVRATRAATDDQLRTLLAARVREMRAQGTTTVEIKSGYGLTVADEARALRIAREQTDETTFLGAHVVPEEYAGRRAEYVDLVTGPMLRACAPHARWVDVFCEPHSAHAFTEEESRRVLAAGREAGLGLRLHGNQLGPGPGRAAGRRARGGQRGPLHLPQRGGRRGAGRGGGHHGGDAAAGGGVLDPVALPGRPAPGRRRGVGRARDRLQPRHLLLVVDAVRDRARGPRDAPDPG